MKRGLKQKKSTGRQTLVSKVSYVKRNWQLYVFFLMPALVLTIIFKYLPMGGLLIAFEDYNVIKGVFGSPWAVSYTHLMREFITPSSHRLIWIC